MPIVLVEGIGKAGIIRDQEPYSVAPEYWTNGANVRFKDGKVQKFLGEAEIYPTWGAYAQPQRLLPVVEGADVKLLASTPVSILKMDSSAVSDVTRTAGAYNGTTDSIWSACVLGGLPIFNNDSFLDPPQAWDSGTSLFVDLPNWPASTYCSIIRPFKQYLVALDIIASSVRQEHVVKWSSPALPGVVPDFWDNADTNDSNEQPLSEGGGRLIDCKALADINVVYKEEMTYGMQLTGGPFVFTFYKMFDQSGILAPECAKEFFNKHFVVTKSDVIVHDGQQAQSVIDSKNRSWLFANLHPASTRKSFVVHNIAYNEMWICFVSNSVAGTYPDLALVWNYKENNWGVRTLSTMSHIALGRVDTGTSSDIIDDQTQFIDSDTSLIDGAVFSSGRLVLIGSPGDYAGEKVVQLDTTNEFAGTAMTSYVERTGLTIVGKDHRGEFKLDPSSVKFLRRVYPKINATGAVNIYVGSQQTLQGSVTWTGPYSFDPNTQEHIDCRVQGVALAIRYESDGDIEWSSTGFALDLEVLSGYNR